jgi:hypothetical protein
VHSDKSRPVDLDQVTARLLKAAASTGPSTRTSDSPSTNAGIEEERVDSVIDEKAAYQNLIANGGRPWYPLHLLEQVSQTPEAHRDLFRFWSFDGLPDYWLVFSRQWERWMKFLKWQEDNRGLLDVQADFEREKAAVLSWSARHGGTQPSADAEDNWTAMLTSIKNERERQHRYSVEDGLARKKDEERFPAYVFAMRARLGRHGFERAVQLEQDPKDQDTLTTWIEYLNYEYWVRDRFAKKAAHLQAQHDQLLDDLMKANVLLPNETPKSITKFHHGFQLDRETRLANQAVKAAESAVSAAEEAVGGAKHDVHHQDQETTLTQAKTSLEKAVKAAKAAEKRTELISNYVKVHDPYFEAKGSAENHEIMLRWVLDQIRLIESEMAEVRTEPSPSQKRVRGTDEEAVPDGPAAKRRKPEAQTAQEVKLQLGPELMAESTSVPGRKRTRNAAGEKDLKETDSDRQNQGDGDSWEGELDPETGAGPPRGTQGGRDQGVFNGKAVPGNKMRQNPRGSAQSTDAPPPRRSARIATTQQDTSSADAQESTTRQAVASSGSKSAPKASKPAPTTAPPPKARKGPGQDVKKPQVSRQTRRKSGGG